MPMNAQHRRRVFLAERGRPPALHELSPGRQKQFGPGRERPEVPELLDVVLARRPAHTICDKKNAGLSKLNSTPVREAGVTALGFE
jgi:hypothetical protein